MGDERSGGRDASGRRNTGGAEIWSLFVRTHAAVVRRLDRELIATTGLPLTWYDVLLELASAPDSRLRMRELGNRVVLSRSRVSRVVDELERKALVVREADPSDRRGAYAVLTASGRAALHDSAPVYLAGIDEHFAAHLTVAEREALRAGLHRVLAAQEDLDARESGRPPRLPTLPT